MSDSLILASYGIDVTDLEIYDVLDQTDREISIRIRLRRNDISCPHCGCLSDIKIKDYKHKKYRLVNPSFYFIEIDYL